MNDGLLGFPTPLPKGGKLIESKTIGAAIAFVDFTNLIGFAKHELWFTGVTVASGTSAIAFRVRRMADATWLALSIYKSYGVYTGSATGVVQTWASPGTSLSSGTGTTGYNNNGVLQLVGMNSAASPMVSLDHVYSNDTNAYFVHWFGLVNDINPKDGLRVFVTSGVNLTAGTFNLYGY